MDLLASNTPQQPVNCRHSSPNPRFFYFRLMVHRKQKAELWRESVPKLLNWTHSAVL